jgi:hypothetical protein
MWRNLLLPCLLRQKPAAWQAENSARTPLCSPITAASDSIAITEVLCQDTAGASEVLSTKFEIRCAEANHEFGKVNSPTVVNPGFSQFW